jgi:glycosyltransferase involved in cell wall biosynthesis/GT2 family glycosyltransferase
VPPERQPVSIVVATHARPAFLSECVASIAAAMSPSDELIVVECCNPDAAAVLGDLGVTVRHLSEGHAGKSAKLNAAIRAAQSEVLLITDDDCRVSAGWVEAMAGPFGNPAVGAVFGPSSGLSSAPGGPAPVLPAGPAPPELWNYAHGLSMAVRRRAALDVGGFDERLGPGAAVHGEEGDLVLRLAARGWTTEIASAPPVEHLEWRDPDETWQNLLVYQRGAGAYLGSALRRNPSRTVKPLLLRLAHERGWWQDRDERGPAFGPRMTKAFAAGLVQGLGLPPRRFLPAAPPPSSDRSRPRVLWVTDEPPDRNKGGGNIRQAMLLDALHGRIDVTLLLAGHLEDDATRARLAAVMEVPRPRPQAEDGPVQRRVRDLWRVVAQRRPADVTGSARVHRVLAPVVGRIADDFDVVIVQHLTMAPLLPRRRRSFWMLELHNLASVRTRQELEIEEGRRQRWLLQRETANAARYEHDVVIAYDGVIVVSEADARTVGVEGALVVPNGVAVGAEPPPIGDEPTILLPATLDYRPNVLGAQWFCDEVLPLVQEKIPAVRFALVGRHPTAEVVALAERDGVELHADVPRMAPWLAWARVVVVPLHIGTGTRLKALEAMAAGRPLVGTTIGLEGLGLVDGVHARICDDPDAMAQAVVELLSSDAAAEALITAARGYVDSRFRWEMIASRLASFIEVSVRSMLGTTSRLG